jgi:hypothetical protein
MKRAAIRSANRRSDTGRTTGSVLESGKKDLMECKPKGEISFRIA